jgi:hypothetical protein
MPSKIKLAQGQFIEMSKFNDAPVSNLITHRGHCATRSRRIMEYLSAHTYK